MAKKCADGQHDAQVGKWNPITGDWYAYCAKCGEHTSPTPNIATALRWAREMSPKLEMTTNANRP